MRQYHFSKLARRSATWTYLLLPGIYFLVMSIIIYRFFGITDIFFYIAEGALIAAMFWGFLDGFRTSMAIIIFALIFVHFMMGNIYASAIFLVSPFLLFNMRDLGAIAIVGLILLIPYTLSNEDKMIREASRIDMAKLYSSILFNMPQYTLTSTRSSILIDMIINPKELDSRMIYHVAPIKYGSNKGNWKIVDGYNDPMHPEYQKHLGYLEVLNKKDKGLISDASKKKTVSKIEETNITCEAGEFEVMATTLTVREFPDKGSKSMSLLKRGESVCGSIKKRGWIYVDKKRGWTSLSFLKKL